MWSSDRLCLCGVFALVDPGEVKQGLFLGFCPNEELLLLGCSNLDPFNLGRWPGKRDGGRKLQFSVYHVDVDLVGLQPGQDLLLEWIGLSAYDLRVWIYLEDIPRG